MTAQILDGKAAVAAIKSELRVRVSAPRKHEITPGLGTILVSSDSGSQWYVADKHRDCAEVGIESIRIDLPETATQHEVEAAVDRLNADPACTGYIVQLPRSKGLDAIATVTLCHTGTRNLAAEVRRAESNNIAGDVSPAASDVAGWVAPNPGGVGPMTRVLLLANVVDTAEQFT